MRDRQCGRSCEGHEPEIRTSHALNGWLYKEFRELHKKVWHSTLILLSGSPDLFPTNTFLLVSLPIHDGGETELQGNESRITILM